MTRRLACAFLLAALTPYPAAGQHHDQLGTVTFPTSCAAAVQDEFNRGVAMLHSYWFNYAGKTFRNVLAQDPACTIAYWGVALDLLGNTLSAPPSAAAAKVAWEALEKASTMPVKTDRERDWLDEILGADRFVTGDRFSRADLTAPRSGAQPCMLPWSPP